MPCSDDRGYSPSPQEIKNREIKDRLACDYCTMLEALGAVIPDYAKSWWEDHKEWDRRRSIQDKAFEHEQKLRRAALESLTSEQRKALNL